MSRFASHRKFRRRERGYALLFVLFLGALVAIGLALSLPRAAVEAQRAKEDVLIYRGSQYSRAVQLYFRKFRKYPASMDDLEKTNNVRFLRRRYTDPITKSDEEES
jgi:type II secretory pathway pseudopilin PulG